MKIILSAYACRPHSGSEPGNGWNWCQYLAQLGHEIWLLTVKSERDEVAAACKAFPLVHPSFVETPQLPLGLGRLAGGRLSYFAWQAAALEEARNIASTHAIDLTHHITYGSLQGGSQLWKLPLPFIFGPVGGGQTAPWRFFRYYRQGGGYELVRTLVTKALRFFPPAVQAVRHAALVLATNSDTVRVISTLGGQQAQLLMDFGVPEGLIPAHCPQHDAQPDVFRVLWVGRLIPRKALLLALETLVQVPASVQIKMTILGSGPQAAQIPKWIAALGLTNRVEFLGSLPWAQVQEFYRTQDVLLFTSIRDSTGMQMVEAMAHGMPIIGLDHQGVHDIVTDEAGIKVPVKTPAKTALALAQALEKLARDPALRLRMGRCAWQNASEYAWPKRALAMTKIYAAVLNRSRDSMEPTCLT